jgi:two-component system chemotaxis response regulator CheY
LSSPPNGGRWGIIFVPKKIFIVDDADFMVDMLSLILKNADYSVVGTAFNGIQAMDMIRNLPPDSMPDIVTVDFHMPKMGGIETIEEIRSVVPQMKFVLITSHATKEIAAMAKSVGVNAFIVKPFEPQRVLDTIARL